MKEKAYSIVIPVYNSEKTLDELCSRLKAVFRAITENYEIILVDDCSREKSWEVMKRLCAEDKRIIAIRLAKNFGQHNTTLCGLSHAKGEYVIIMDDDLQHPPEEIPKLISRIREGYSVVYGKYKIKYHSRIENIFSGIFQSIMHRTLNIPNKVFISSFAIFTSEAVENAISIKSPHVFLPAFMAKSVDPKKITNTEVVHQPRKVGSSNYTLGKYFKLSLDLIINHSALPLIAASAIGLVISVLSILWGLVIIVEKVLDPTYGIMGWNSLMVAIAFLGGMILMFLGIIGEYLRRILADISHEQQYLIGEKSI
jgi:glycosyltransferase involved in cell wall biosynthesis